MIGLVSVGSAEASLQRRDPVNREASRHLVHEHLRYRGRLSILARRVARHTARYSKRFGRFSYANREERRSSTAGESVRAIGSSSVQVGRASYYGGNGRTASGGHIGSATCAHRWLPFGTRILVTNLRNLRRAILTVNDRGPFARGRIVDVSRGAAGMLGMIGAGVANVRLEVLGAQG